ncbi:hypothetical protein NECAME_10663 [Necator americanus]|uniref:IRS-type PTB domain-containing protein n=1 Tax=Necator americanus TaxID=51031 RepID=W2T7W1_NECAM|nr:hypothetical protein NECAME_10663 [Necator americanus]ETN77963.1 hypothetical protein NECAME_10663 [Necator americanus]
MASTVNLEEETGVIKSGPVIAGFAPIKSRKCYYAVLCERALELHESEKTYRKRKSARHLIDLSTAFNVHNEHFDPKLKRCVCVMGPDETLCLKVDDGGKNDEFTEIPRKCVAFFGCQERFFLMRLGRGAPSGASELWAQCDSEEVALDIHNKLNAIIERESEKERKMNNGVVKPLGLLTLRSHQGHHRERCHTQPQRQRATSFLSGRVATSTYSTNSPISGKPSTPSTQTTSTLGSRAYSISYGSQAASKNQPPLLNTLMSVFPRQPSQEDCGVYQAMVAPKNSCTTPSTSTANETSTDNVDAISTAKPKDQVLDEAQSSHQLSSATHHPISGELTPTPDLHRTSTTFDDGYTPMHAAEWTSAGSNSHLIMPMFDRYKLEEVRSYVSAGAANCSTDLQSPANPPRAYSFAGRCNLRPGANAGLAESADARTENTENAGGGLLQPVEDPRKRAFSLGSKTLFQRPFRKISQHTSRQQRVSQTSVSSVSLASSEFSSSFGPSSSANHLSAVNCADKDDYSRNRSGSFGSGRSTPHHRKGGSSAGQRDGADHFVEMDFGNDIRRSGSGSVVSVDSPSNCIRSRTSSFGCAIRKDTEVFSYPADLSEAELTPSQIVLEQARQNSIDESCDYVIPVAPDLEAVKSALSEAANDHPHLLGFPTRIEPKSIDMHSSQHFETIVESTSLKSSPCSSQSSITMDLNKDTSKEEDYITCIGQKCEVLSENPSFVPYCARTNRPASSPGAKEVAPKATTLLPQLTSVPPTLSKSGIVFSHNFEAGKPLLEYASIKPVRAMSY